MNEIKKKLRKGREEKNKWRQISRAEKRQKS
jgi:hypothetical protein